MKPEYRQVQSRGGNGTAAALLDPGGPLAGRYELRALLGRGGMSEVRDGWDRKLGRPVAIKLLHPVGGDRPEHRLRFAMEAHAAATLSGEHIVVVHDVGEHDGLPFIVMERLPGVTLADHIARGPLPPQFVQGVLDDILAALTVAHDAGIVHRDVKPGNVLFTAAGAAKLADFGIAKADGGVHTMTGEIVGSVAYLSPARLTSKPATPADDLYAAGVIGYEALAGRRPFPQTALGPLAHAILHETPAPLAALRPDAPRSLTAAIERAMVRETAHQFDQASVMRAALSSTDPVTVALRTPTRTAPMPSLAPSLGPALGTYGFIGDPSERAHPRRRLWAAALIATFLLAVLLIMVVPPFSTPAPAPANTTTPAPAPPPPPTTVPAATTSSVPAPAPAPPPGRKGKKPKGARGD
jgi:serine/threonine protein kinase